MHEDFWGTGKFQQAIEQASQLYFKQTKNGYYNALIDIENKRSYWALKKAGMADIGISSSTHQYELIMRNK